MSHRPAAAPGLSLASALDRHEPLAALLRRWQVSRAHFEAVVSLLPPALRDDVRPGPIDDHEWTLLASHNSAAAKLRQLLPHLLQALQQRGWGGSTIRVRVQPKAAPG